MSAGSLSGIRIVDLTASVAGPFATLILGDLGAEVVKVERPDVGDDTRQWGPPFWNGWSCQFLAMNRNKRSLAADLKDERGRDIVRKLAQRSDVFVQNLRPGTAEKLGLGYEALSAANPRLIYCDMTGFGPAGPLRDRPAYDPLMQAYGGLMSLTGEEGRPPVRTPSSILDQGTGMWTAIAVLDALRTRDVTGRGMRIHTSLLQTALMWLPAQYTGVLGTGKVPARLGSGSVSIAPYQAFPTADDYLVVAAGNDGLYRKLCRVIERPDLIDDPRFADNPHRVQNRHLLAEELSRTLRTKPRRHWMAALEAEGVPVTPIQTLDQVIADEQVAAIGGFTAAEHPDIPDFKIVNTPLMEDGAYPEMRLPPPRLGQHTADVLRELGYPDGAIAELQREGIVKIDSGTSP